MLFASAGVFAQERLPAEDVGGMAVIGAAVGTPAGVSLVGGYYFSGLAVRVSGGSWGRYEYGLQGDCSVILNRGSLFSHGIALFAGRFSTQTHDDAAGFDVVRTQNYAGAGYDLFLAGFYLEAGLGFGTSRAPEYRNPLPVLQAGYLFHF